jgi:hypothetical protein
MFRYTSMCAIIVAGDNEDKTANPFVFEGKAPELLKKSDFDPLLADPPTLEGRYLEYRLPTPVKAPADAQTKAQIRMLRTVSALANTEGG